jgi:RNA recognition motif-containing protein
MPQSHASEADPQNTTLFIGGLSAAVGEDDLRITFSRYGPIVYTKVPPGKGCGFVQFVNRHEAENAMRELQVSQVPWPLMRQCSVLQPQLSRT